MDVCNDKGKYCAILWASGNYCEQLELVIPLAHRLSPAITTIKVGQTCGCFTT